MCVSVILAIFNFSHLFPYSFYLHLNVMQTGSGKTYTMGTGFKDGGQTGLVLQVMNTLFNKIETLKHQSEFQLHVSFIEVCQLIPFFCFPHIKESFSCPCMSPRAVLFVVGA